jgi:hypothetical protein
MRVRPRSNRVRPSAAQKSIGRIAACAIDSHEFLKGHRLQPAYGRELSRRCRDLETAIVTINLELTGQI